MRSVEMGKNESSGMGEKTKLTAMLALFFGFPAVGLLTCFADVQQRMRSNAEPKAVKVAQEMLSEGPLTISLADGVLRSDVEAARNRALALRAAGARPEGKPQLGKAWAGEDVARDMTYAYVQVAQPLADGRGEFRFVLERPTREITEKGQEPPGWRLAEFNYSKVEPQR